MKSSSKCTLRCPSRLEHTITAATGFAYSAPHGVAHVHPYGSPARARRPGRGQPPATTGALGVDGLSVPADVAQRWHLRQARRCAPESAGVVRQLCRTDRSVLPRWHQDDRGETNAHRGIHVQAPDGAYSRIPVWSGREHWLTFAVPVAIAVHRHELVAAHISPDSLRQWALVKSGYANPRTGRRVVVRPDTIASVLGVTERHVERMNALARKIGLEVVALVGRMLTFEESAAARRRGSRQRGLSTEVALTVPSAIREAVCSVTPTRGKASSRQQLREREFLHAASGEMTDAATRRARPKRSCKLGPARRTAAELVRIVPWLARERPGRMAPALNRFVHATTPWTAADIATALDARDRRWGRGVIFEADIRTRPAVLLAHMLTDVDPWADHPRLPELEAACTYPGCDGHGWINETDGDGYAVARPCPQCPPWRRANREDAGTDDWSADDSDDPRF